VSTGFQRIITSFLTRKKIVPKDIANQLVSGVQKPSALRHAYPAQMMNSDANYLAINDFPALR
jgi:hypothetical protein